MCLEGWCKGRRCPIEAIIEVSVAEVSARAKNEAPNEAKAKQKVRKVLGAKRVLDQTNLWEVREVRNHFIRIFMTNMVLTSWLMVKN